MLERVNAFKAAVSLAVAAATALWGWFGWLCIAWAACMAIDYGTGYAAALRNGEWSSEIARAGRWHKYGSIITVLVAGILDAVVGHLIGSIPGVILPFEYTVLFAPLSVSWYIMMEMGSILENVGKLGAPMPAWLRRAIKMLNDTVDAAGDAATKEDDR